MFWRHSRLNILSVHVVVLEVISVHNVLAVPLYPQCPLALTKPPVRQYKYNSLGASWWSWLLVKIIKKGRTQKKYSTSVLWFYIEWYPNLVICTNSLEGYYHLVRNLSWQLQPYMRILFKKEKKVRKNSSFDVRHFDDLNYVIVTIYVSVCPKVTKAPPPVRDRGLSRECVLRIPSVIVKGD